MYTKNYYKDDGERVKIPEKYDGTSLLESISEDPPTSVPPYEPPRAAEAVFSKKDLKISPITEKEEPPEEKCEAAFSKGADGGLLSSLFSRGAIGRFGSLLGFKGGDLLSSFGTEELIIIAIALFLLFSKGGDKECAIILGILLFVK